MAHNWDAKRHAKWLNFNVIRQNVLWDTQRKDVGSKKDFVVPAKRLSIIIYIMEQLKKIKCERHQRVCLWLPQKLSHFPRSTEESWTQSCFPPSLMVKPFLLSFWIMRFEFPLRKLGRVFWDEDVATICSP